MTDQTTTAFVPAGARVFLRRRFEELIGFVLLLLGAADLVALLSAKQNDKSFNVATDEPVRNLLGAPGAYVADLTLQSLGLAAFMLAVALGIWGLQLMRHRSATRWWLRAAYASARARSMPKSAARFSAVSTIPEIGPNLASGWDRSRPRSSRSYSATVPARAPQRVAVE